MALPKVILYYIFTPLSDPAAIKIWQKTLCTSLNLKGRIIISPHGINGTLGGDIEDLKKYIRQTRSYEGFAKMKFKWSEGTGNDFPKLSVKVRPELVAFGHPDEIKVDKNGVVGAGKHLKPTQVDELVAKRGDDVVFFDGRNAFEAQVGRFKNAVVPDTATTRDFVAEIESGKYDHLKDKPIVTYCTGGIRCEVLSSVMTTRGFKEVYQIDGGIVRYGEKFKDSGLWEGSLYIFDDRMVQDFSDETKVIGECENCAGPTNAFRNCSHLGCKDLILLCDTCYADPKHSEHKDTHTRGKRHADQIG